MEVIFFCAPDTSLITQERNMYHRRKAVRNSTYNCITGPDITNTLLSADPVGCWLRAVCHGQPSVYSSPFPGTARVEV